MATSAIVMMCIGCIGLWGGCAFSISIAMRHSKKGKIPPKRIRTQKNGLSSFVRQTVFLMMYG